jgi:hypothetical protein
LRGPESLAISPFPDVLGEFRQRRTTVLWRGSRDGFRASTFHLNCDGHPNTLVLIRDVEGNIFGGFTPVAWESRVSTSGFGNESAAASFLFTLRNPSGVPPMRFPLKSRGSQFAITCDRTCGPHFHDLAVLDKCNTHKKNFSRLGESYENPTSVEGNQILTGAETFIVAEIEVHEIE